MNIIKGKRLANRLDFLFRRFFRRLKIQDSINVFGSSKDKIGAIFIINLNRQVERWNQYKKEASIQKVKENKNLLDYSYRISAIDGKELDLKTFTSKQITNSYNLNDQYYVDPDPRLLSIIRKKTITVDLTKEEIAVALSHVKVWERIVDERLSYALILEDDVFFESDFATRLNEIWQELQDNHDTNTKFDLLYLSYREVDQGAEKEYVSKNLFCPIRGLWWLSGYILSYSGAKKILEELPICGPVDLWLNHKFKKLKVYASTKVIIYQRIDLKSDNNYSILPVLSQIGIQSDKTHLILESLKGKNPVFLINFNDYKSEIIGNVLSILGYRCCINRWNEFSCIIDKYIINDEPLLFDAYIGFKSILKNFKKLDLLYPSAVFILIEDNNGKNVEIPIEDRNRIIEYFINRRDKLFISNIEALKNWNQLCNFLDCKIPSFPFPDFESFFNNISKLDMNESILKHIDIRTIKIQEHDVHPWIIPIENLQSFGISRDFENKARFIGIHNKVLEDKFNVFDNSTWLLLENSFPSNQALFTKSNFIILKDSGFQIIIMKEKSIQKDYTSASIVTKESHYYGRFELQMKPVKANGIITAFFLHRNNPWQEIDFEFLGNDTTKALINVYYNPGEDGTRYNYGNRGTPILIDLNFDASQDFHEYAIEWEPHEIRWYIDKNIVHKRGIWEPTPIPDCPMQFFVNTWPSRSEELVGNIDDSKLPQSSFVKMIRIYSWSTGESAQNGPLIPQ